MDIREYQGLVMQTCLTGDHEDMIKLSLIGLQGELGEVAEPLKKYLWCGHAVDLPHLESEIGDVMWYLATLCNALGIDLEHAMEKNIGKLHRRYPDGFSPERSRNRVDESEVWE